MRSLNVEDLLYGPYFIKYLLEPIFMVIIKLYKLYEIPITP